MLVVYIVWCFGVSLCGISFVSDVVCACKQRWNACQLMSCNKQFYIMYSMLTVMLTSVCHLKRKSSYTDHWQCAAGEP